MNNLHPNSGRDRSCSPESPVPFLPPPSNQRKGSGLRVLRLKKSLLTGGFKDGILPHHGEFDLGYGQNPHVSLTPPRGGGQHIDRCIIIHHRKLTHSVRTLSVKLDQGVFSQQTVRISKYPHAKVL